MNERSWGGGATIPILGGVDIRSGQLSHEHNGGGGYKKNFKF